MKRNRPLSLIVLAGMLIAGSGAWLINGAKTAEATGDASFNLAPGSGTYSVGNTINVAVSETSSAGDNTNAVQVNLSFPAALLSWQSTNLTGPFSLCAQNSHTAGTVSLACAATTAQNGTQAIATISFTVLAGGNAGVAFASGSDIDNTSGASVWNGVLPGVTYTLSGPPPSTPTPAPAKKTSTTTAAKATATPTPSASPTPSPSASPAPSATPAPSSKPLGSISITVSDAAGRVSGATVDFDGQFGQTNSSGVVNFSGVKSGSHTLTITAPGDKSFSTTVDIMPGQNALVSYKLTKDAGNLPTWLLWTIIGGLVLGGLAGLSVWLIKIRRARMMPQTNL